MRQCLALLQWSRRARTAIASTHQQAIKRRPEHPLFAHCHQYLPPRLGVFQLHFGNGQRIAVPPCPGQLQLLLRIQHRFTLRLLQLLKAIDFHACNDPALKQPSGFIQRRLASSKRGARRT
ncbi:hypothetical protein D9M71_357640 [compost metagenome]